MAIERKDLPGPKGIPVLGNTFQLDLSRLHQQIENWSNEFGGVFKIQVGIHTITIVSDPKIYQVMLKERPDGFVRSKKMDRVLREGGVNGVFNAEFEDWRIHRKMVASGLDVKHQKAFFPTLVKITERLYEKWKKQTETGEEFDIEADFLRYTVDVTTSLAFGYEMNTIEEQDDVIQDHMEHIFPMVFKRINQPIPWHRLFKSKSDKQFEHSLGEINKLVNELIQNGKKRIAENPDLRENPENFLDAILIASENEAEFTDEHVRGNLLTLLFAGEDTTAHTLAWSMVMLANSEQSRSQLFDEANQLFSENVLNQYDKTNHLKFTESVAMETMRLKPVAPLLITQATKDIEIGEYLFKKDHRIVISTRAAALQNEHFSDAKDFNPNRWMKQSKCPVHNTEAFIPFGSGPRFCPGRNLALLEIKMVLSMLFKNFEVEMITPTADIKEKMAFTMMSSGFKVKLKERN